MSGPVHCLDLGAAYRSVMAGDECSPEYAHVIREAHRAICKTWPGRDDECARDDHRAALRTMRRECLMAVACWLADSSEIAEDETTADTLYELSEVAFAAARGRESTIDAHGLPRIPEEERPVGMLDRDVMEAE